MRAVFVVCRLCVFVAFDRRESRLAPHSEPYATDAADAEFALLASAAPVGKVRWMKLILAAAAAANLNRSDRQQQRQHAAHKRLTLEASEELNWEEQ